jgi:hypothetical protein
MNEDATRRELSRMCDQLQGLEIHDGYDALMKSPLYHKFEALKKWYEAKTGKPFEYQSGRRKKDV